MHLTIIGTGYVGLVAGACFAEAGHSVTCVDRDPARIAALREGRVPFFEPGLSELVALQRSRLRFETELREAADLIFITVGVSPTDLDALTPLVASLPDRSTIVLKSTVAVGTSDHLARKFPAHTFIANPEFLREGAAVADFRSPERVVIGSSDEHARRRVASLYAPANILFMAPRSAELSKLAANAMLATRISVMNELARIADSHHADLSHVQRVLGSDSRIGSAYLDAGIGFGGSCLPKDLRALAPSSALFAAVEEANTRARSALVTKALEHFGGSLHGKRLAVWGLTFKADTDDVRESPALAIARTLLDLGATVTAFDPAARPPLDARFTTTTSAEAAALGAEALFILTPWPQFAAVDLDRLRASMTSAVIFDGRNCLDPEHARAKGFSWFGIGRATVTS